MKKKSKMIMNLSKKRTLAKLAEEKVATAPRIAQELQGTVGQKAFEEVWDNEDASMQDKSYNYDEETTDADYDSEDSLNFKDQDAKG